MVSTVGLTATGIAVAAPRQSLHYLSPSPNRQVLKAASTDFLKTFLKTVFLNTEIDHAPQGYGKLAKRHGKRIGGYCQLLPISGVSPMTLPTVPLGHPSFSPSFPEETRRV
jgi:hypothetical protein